MLEVKFYDSVDDSLLKFAVIVSQSNGKWVFCKHKERDTYEVPGGHREAGESILETAKRELQEETGAIRLDMKPLCVYSVTGKTRVNDTGEESFGLLCYAEITEFATELHSEMEKIVLLDELPEEWTYPLIQPKLIEKYLQMKNIVSAEKVMMEAEEGGKIRTDITDYLQKEVYRRCKQPTNKFGMGCYYHIEAVVKNAEKLAEKYGADKEIVIIAAWLHDIASITDYAMYEEHHIYGASIAKEILNELHYEKEKIELVQECILNHRGSVNREKNSREELCVADADAISHFDNVPSLLYLAYGERKMGIEEGVKFVKAKLERSYNKLSDESKEFYNEKCKQVMEVLDVDATLG